MIQATPRPAAVAALVLVLAGPVLASRLAAQNVGDRVRVTTVGAAVVGKVSALFPTDLAAQASLSVGGGLTMSKVISSTTGLDLVPDSRTGITAGIRLTRPLSGLVALEVGGAYVQKGYEVSPGESERFTLKLDYLELTALAKLISYFGGFQGGEGPSLHLLAGPALGITMNCSEEEEGETDDCADYVTTADLGVLVGAGIQMGRFRIDATYTLGISDIVAETDGDNGVSVKNRSMALQAGFVIPLGVGS